MVAIHAGAVFDGATSYGPALVYVEETCIAAVDRTAAAPPSDQEVINLGEAVLMPGTVDAHVHLAIDASADVVGHLTAANDDELLEVMRVRSPPGTVGRGDHGACVTSATAPTWR